MRSRALRRLLAFVPVLAAGRGGGDATCDASSGACRSDGGEAGSCCPSGSWPALQPPEDYKPRGMDEFLEDLPVYVAGQPGPKAVVVLPEIFGFAGRLKGICDTLADEGYFVVMVDSFRGDSAAGKANPLEWIANTPFDTVVGPDLNACFPTSRRRASPALAPWASVGALGPSARPQPRGFPSRPAQVRTPASASRLQPLVATRLRWHEESRCLCCSCLPATTVRR